MVRGEDEEDNTLFMSPVYGHKECPILAAASWFALCAGILNIKDLVLPEVNTDWWKGETAIEQFEGTGIAPA